MHLENFTARGKKQERKSVLGHKPVQAGMQAEGSAHKKRLRQSEKQNRGIISKHGKKCGAGRSGAQIKA